MQLTIVLFVAAFIAVQAAPEREDPLSGLPFDLYENSAPSDFNSLELGSIQPLVSALGSVFNLGFSYREKNLANLKNGLTPTDYQTVMHGVKALDKALETIKPAIPALKSSLTTLSTALPALSAVVTKYQKAGSSRTGLFPSGFYQDMFQFFPALNRALEELAPVVEIVADVVIILTNELPEMSSAIPALSRYLSAHSAGMRSQLGPFFPAFDKTAAAVVAANSKLTKNALPALISFLTSIGTISRAEKLVYSAGYYPVSFPNYQQYPFRHVYG